MGKLGSEGDAGIAGANEPVLQAEPAAHLFVLCERRVQSENPVPVQVSVNCSSAVVLSNAIIRHEKPTDSALAKQNVQDRPHGHDDPVAQTIIAKCTDNPGLNPLPRGLPNRTWLLDLINRHTPTYGT